MPVRNAFPHEMVGSGCKATGSQDSSLSNVDITRTKIG